MNKITKQALVDEINNAQSIDDMKKILIKVIDKLDENGKQIERIIKCI